jgi:chaperonin GroES
MAQRVRPLFDRILVKKLEDNRETTPGGIIIPDNAKNPSQRAEVVSVGDGRNYDGPGAQRTIGPDGKIVAETQFARTRPVVKPGDVILFGKFSGTEVELLGETLFILREDEVLAVVEEVAVAQVVPESPADREPAA